MKMVRDRAKRMKNWHLFIVNEHNRIFLIFLKKVKIYEIFIKFSQNFKKHKCALISETERDGAKLSKFKVYKGYNSQITNIFNFRFCCVLIG